MLCSQELIRGTKSYKERHWTRKHKSEHRNFQSYIVPKDHIKARELLQQNFSQKKQSRPGATIFNEDIEADVQCVTGAITSGENEQVFLGTGLLDDSNLIDRTFEGTEGSSTMETTLSSTISNVQDISIQSCSSTSAHSVMQGTATLTSKPKAKSTVPMVQTTLTSYLDITEEEQLQGSSDAFKRIECGVKRILLKLDEMNIQENVGKRQVDCSAIDIGDDNVKVANNLVELANCEHICVDILEDGCCVTCIPCHEYIKANPLMKM